MTPRRGWAMRCPYCATPLPPIIGTLPWHKRDLCRAVVSMHQRRECLDL